MADEQEIDLKQGHDLNTRLTRVEVKVDVLEKHGMEVRAEMRQVTAELRTDLKAILEKLQGLDKEQARHGVWVGLVAALGTAIFAELIKVVFK